MTSITTTRAQNAAHEAAGTVFPKGVVQSYDRAAFLLACAVEELPAHDKLRDALEMIHEAMTGDPEDMSSTADSAAKGICEWAEEHEGQAHGGRAIARRAA